MSAFNFLVSFDFAARKRPFSGISSFFIDNVIFSVKMIFSVFIFSLFGFNVAGDGVIGDLRGVPLSGELIFFISSVTSISLRSFSVASACKKRSFANSQRAFQALGLGITLSISRIFVFIAL